MLTLQIRTNSREELVNITSSVQNLIRENNLDDGILLLFCPHTTGALTINEAADPDVARDINVNMSKLVPRRGDYRHAEGNSDGHIKSSLFGPSLPLIVEQNRAQLGTWQGVYFCEFDGPRTRKVWAKWLKA